MTSFYEHHMAIQKNKLCPFKVMEIPNGFTNICNWHKNIEILLVFSGQGTIQYDKDALPLESGDIIVINSGSFHRPYSSHGIGYYIIIIDESFCLENGIDTSQICFDRRFRDAETEKLLRLMIERMGAYSADAQTLTVARLRAAALDLLIDLVSHHANPEPNIRKRSAPSEEYVRKALDYINENYTAHVNLDQIAALCGITKCHLAREFKQLTGQTVLTYTNILRCKKAEMLLVQGKTVTEAALESGFGNLSYFSKTYKKFMNIHPSKNKTI